ncbi:SPX domain-containing protein [Ascodesmis nigricans]|uniref:SPX domain-containing protein n=1 Tax=Ascodesmis nigricans TaxID=341454 RepID=A0A4S2MWG4_9PEZI|nr:SPX domain-containing protein [Ascodesmis nigricans]
MKFSHSVQFNAVPEWASNYIAYSNLKKLIYSLEKRVVQTLNEGGDTEHTALISDQVDTDAIFAKALDAELEKISNFYNEKESSLFSEVDELAKDAQEFQEGRSPDIDLDGSGILDENRVRRRYSDWRNTGNDDDDNDDSDDDERGDRAGLIRPKSRRRSSVHSGGSDGSRPRRFSIAYGGDGEDDEVNVLYDLRVTLKKRAISLFVALRELKSFSQLNRTGFRKALKKYDKILDRRLLDRYMGEKVAPANCFTKSTLAGLDAKIAEVERIYAAIVTDGDLMAAQKDLRLHLREHVVWERNTVWREMIGIERKANAAHMSLEGVLGDVAKKVQLAGDDPVVPRTKILRTPFGRFEVPIWLFSTGFFTLGIILAVFIALINIPIFETPEQQNCFAMLVFVSLLWATEVIPLFVTSLLIPFLVVILGVVRQDSAPHLRLPPKEATKYIFSAMWTPVIMLLLGGFTLAAALSKYGIAKRMAVFVLAKAGTRPRTVLITNMFVAMFASMWISNVAAPVLCFSIIQPLLRNLPSESDFSAALLLGIALASNIGGMASPIASPQNIIALENMHPAPSWGVWFFIAIPVCIISILMTWVLLLLTFRISSKDTTIVPIRPMKDPFSRTEWFITLTTIATIALWCASHQLEQVFGDMGVIAILPIVLFFGTGILTKEDFNNFLWTIIILAAGGLSLGKAVNSSGLLHTIATSIQHQVTGYSVYSILVIFCSLILVIATFISHTVAALIILPIVAQVGAGVQHANLLVMGSALLCSAAMGLPTSGFPNMTAIMMEDMMGRRYLRVAHFLTRGVPASVLTFGVIVTVGYGLMRIVGF